MRDPRLEFHMSMESECGPLLKELGMSRRAALL